MSTPTHGDDRPGAPRDGEADPRDRYRHLDLLPGAVETHDTGPDRLPAREH